MKKFFLLCLALAVLALGLAAYRWKPSQWKDTLVMPFHKDEKSDFVMLKDGESLRDFAKEIREKGLVLDSRNLLYWLTKKQYVSMAKMRILTPKMNELKELYKDDRQKLSMAMMELYQKEKVNPLGGCLPILIQMPIFIALYWTFMESTELRHSAFCLWIQDLSAYDPYFVLPILMGVTMLIIQKMSPTTITDPMQKKIMLLMPIVFTGLFCTFPAGLTLYWLVSNIFTIIQQMVIFRALEKKGLSLKNQTK